MAGDKKAGKVSPKKGAAKSSGASVIEGKSEEVKKKKKTSPLEFFQQVRAEGSKVTWTSWKETWISTLMVLVMVFIMAIFFLIVDQGIRFGVCQILPIQCAAANS